MTYLRCLFACPRNVLFRPTAIGTGWLLGQYVAEWLR